MFKKSNIASAMDSTYGNLMNFKYLVHQSETQEKKTLFFINQSN